MAPTPDFTRQYAPNTRGSYLQLGLRSTSQLLGKPPVHLGSSFKAVLLRQMLVAAAGR